MSDAEDCHKCGARNAAWYAASPLWNYVMRGNDINGEPIYGDMVCIRCFIELAEYQLGPCRWQLTVTPEPEGLIYETPSGRVWDREQGLWVDPAADPERSNR